VYRVDLGQAGDRYFLLMAGIGLDAEIVKAVPPTLKKHFGVLAFIIAGAHRVLGFGGERAIVDIDGVRRVRWLRLAVVGNTRLYGGLVTMTHEAYIDDGLLDIAIFTNRGSVLAHLQQLAHVFLRRPDPQAGYEYFRGREIRIWTRHRLEVQVDGEHYSQTPITLRVAPLALSVRLPKAGPRGPFSDSQLAESAEPDRPPVVGRMWSFSQQKPDPDS